MKEKLILKYNNDKNNSGINRVVVHTYLFDLTNKNPVKGESNHFQITNDTTDYSNGLLSRADFENGRFCLKIGIENKNLPIWVKEIKIVLEFQREIVHYESFTIDLEANGNKPDKVYDNSVLTQKMDFKALYVASYVVDEDLFVLELNGYKNLSVFNKAIGLVKNRNELIESSLPIDDIKKLKRYKLITKLLIGLCVVLDIGAVYFLIKYFMH